MKIKSITIKDMWSYRQGGNVLSELGQTVVLIGKNNSGKSNVLNAIRWFQQNSKWYMATTASFPIPENVAHFYPDNPDRARSGLTMIIELSEDEIAKILDFDGFREFHGGWQDTIREEMKKGLLAAFDTGWSDNEVPQQCLKLAGLNTTHHLPVADVGLDINKAKKDWMTGMERLKNWVTNHFTEDIKYVGANQRLSDRRFEKNLNLFQLLEQSRAPTPAERHMKKRYAAIECLFKKITKLRDVELAPQHDAARLNIDWRERYLPLECYGDGVSKLLLMAAEFSAVQGRVFLIEEPESHVHPELQREFLRFMTEDQANQYILTTHSPVLLDAGNARCIYQITHDGDKSSCRHCANQPDLYRILDDLGNRASDILQANVVIWVEGHTDRLFIKKCLELRSSEVSEYDHYQFAYYGGSHGAHITFDKGASDKDGLVSVLGLCRRVVVLCDSDRESETGKLRPMVRRFEEECERTGGFFWVTGGREMENYLPNSVLSNAFQDIRSDPHIEIKLDKYSKLADVVDDLPSLKQGDTGNISYRNKGKSRLLPIILSHMSAKDLQQYGLEKELDRLIEYIKQGN